MELSARGVIVVFLLWTGPAHQRGAIQGGVSLARPVSSAAFLFARRCANTPAHGITIREMKCPYCQRPARRRFLLPWCGACRRYLLTWAHVVTLAAGLAAALLLLLLR